MFTILLDKETQTAIHVLHEHKWWFRILSVTIYKVRWTELQWMNHCMGVGGEKEGRMREHRETRNQKEIF
jgi:hypothetical protein